MDMHPGRTCQREQSFEAFQTTEDRGKERKEAAREKEREKRKPSEFSLTVIISTLRDGSGGVKKRRRREEESEAKWGVLLQGACGFLSDPPPPPSLRTLHLPTQRMRGQRGGEWKERKGKENSRSDQTMSKWKWKEQGRRQKRGRKRSGFQPKYDKTSMNLKHREGWGGKKELHSHSGSIQWFKSGNRHTAQARKSECVCAFTWLCECVRVLARM